MATFATFQNILIFPILDVFSAVFLIEQLYFSSRVVCQVLFAHWSLSLAPWCAICDTLTLLPYYSLCKMVVFAIVQNLISLPKSGVFSRPFWKFIPKIPFFFFNTALQNGQFYHFSNLVSLRMPGFYPSHLLHKITLTILLFCLSLLITVLAARYTKRKNDKNFIVRYAIMADLAFSASRHELTPFILCQYASASALWKIKLSTLGSLCLKSTWVIVKYLR